MDHIINQAFDNLRMHNEIVYLRAKVERLEEEVNYDKRTQLHVDKLAAEFTQHEVERLKAEVERLDTLCKQLMAQHSDISCENTRLRKFSDEAVAHIAKEERKSRERLDMAQAEVELLRKAGDAMAFALYVNPNTKMTCDPEIKLWNAAKEGKPSV